MKSFGYLGVLFVLFAQAGSDPSLKNIEIQKAFEGPRKELLVLFKYKSYFWDRESGNPEFVGRNLLFYGTEKKLFQMSQKEFAGTENHFKLQFEDPRLGTTSGNPTLGVFYAGVDREDSFKPTANHTVVCGNDSKSVIYQPISESKVRALQQKIRQNRIELVELPHVRKPEHLMKFKDGQLAWIDAPQFDPENGHRRLFIGRPGAMKELPIRSFRKTSDGKAATIKTTDGTTLRLPASSDTSSSAVWKGAERLQILKIGAFDLNTLGIPGVQTDSFVLRTPCDLFFEN